MSDNSDKGAKGDQSGAKPVKVVGPSEGRPAAAKPSSATRSNGVQAQGAPATRSTPAAQKATPAASKDAQPTAGNAPASSAARSTSAKNAETTAAPTKGVPAKGAPAKGAPKGAGAKPAAAAQSKGGSKPSQPTSAQPTSAQGAGKKGTGKKAAEPESGAAQPLGAEAQDADQDVTTAQGGRWGFGAKVREGVARTATFTAVDDASGPDEPHGSTARPVRRARLSLTRIDPWSVAKVSFLLSIAFAVVTFVAVFITWSVLGAAGVWGAINSVIDSFASSNDGTSTFDVRDYVGMGRVLGLTAVLAVVNVVLLTAVATLGAYLYNMASALLGGVEVTLSEDHD